jgi:hypothetical protein
MSKADKILEKVLSGQSDASMRFEDMRHLLRKLGFIARHARWKSCYFPGRPAFCEFAKYAWNG